MTALSATATVAPSTIPERFLNPPARRGWVGVSHAQILTKGVSPSGLALFVHLLDQRPDADGWINGHQTRLSRLMGWLDTRRVRRSIAELVEADWIETSTTGGGAHTLTRHRILLRWQDADAYEQLPRTVVDRITQGCSPRRGAMLLRMWLLWALEANQGTGKGFTTLSVAEFARRYGFKTAKAQRDLQELLELGVLTTVTSDDGTVTVRMAGTDRPGRNVRIAPVGTVDEMSAEAGKKCPTVFRQLLDQPLDPDPRAVDAADDTQPLATAAVPPNMDIKQEAMWAAGQILAGSAQLRSLDPRTRGKIRQGIAREWRRYSDRDVVATIDQVIAELDVLDQMDALGTHHMAHIRRVLRQWTADRLAAPARDLPTHQLVQGPTLEDLAARPLIAMAGVEDLDLVCQNLTVQLAEASLELLTTDPDQAIDRVLRQATTALGTLPDQHRGLIAIAKAKVRTAYHASVEAAEAAAATDQGDIDPELCRIILECLQHAGTTHEGALP